MRANLIIALCLVFSFGLNAKEQREPHVGSTLLKVAPLLSPGGSVLLSNSAGMGTFLNKAQRRELLGSSLTLNASLMVNKVFDDKKMKISAEQKLYFNWIRPEASTQTFFRLSDLIFRATMKDAFLWSNAGISLTPTVEIETPVSALSRTAKRFFGLGTALALAWSGNGFSFSYKPHFTGFINGSLNPPHCEESLKDCSPGVRQTRFMLKNTVAAKYRTGQHAFALTCRLYDAFLRPRPGVLLASGLPESNLSESTLGILEYSYSMPARFPLSFNLGISSYQPLKNAAGTINFPFFDFKTPADNNSELYLEMELEFS